MGYKTTTCKFIGDTQAVQEDLQKRLTKTAFLAEVCEAATMHSVPKIAPRPCSSPNSAKIVVEILNEISLCFTLTFYTIYLCSSWLNVNKEIDLIGIIGTI